ncbi:MAG TPA: VWA domain-containing protein, partial [Thermomicrobiales bacterium]|nr:VWA domain-containing protein [Thermomicrobiales bacterium]
ATVLLIDMSRSMFYNGCWDAAKRSALALDTLLRQQFQRDDLELAGFSERAERLSLMQLPSLEWNEYSHGTNLEDGLRLARELLRPYRGKTRQIILITDGEPTAYNEEGTVVFENPPTERTFDATLREVIRCAREDITINAFLLDRTAGMTEFIETVARLNRGRVIHATAGDLGSYLIRDFLSHRTILIG